MSLYCPCITTTGSHLRRTGSSSFVTLGRHLGKVNYMVGLGLALLTGGESPTGTGTTTRTGTDFFPAQQ